MNTPSQSQTATKPSTQTNPIATTPVVATTPAAPKASSKAKKSSTQTQKSSQKDTTPKRAGASAKDQAAKSVEFRFHCSLELRERMNERLKQLNLERGDIMIEFLEEWLRQTDVYLKEQAASATAITTKKNQQPQADKKNKNAVKSSPSTSKNNKDSAKHP
ncbi:MAG: hypothetical protein OXC44_06715 [Proteobacteria bacterium]|nr:hypothetical protein [Pseudomonadota bacterium]